MHARWPVMVRLAYGLTGDQGHAEDVTQAAFARAYASWPRVSRAGDPDAYVRQIVVNENRNRFRRRRVTERLTGSPPEAGRADVAWTDATRHYDERSVLIAALQRLGPRQRAVIVLRYRDGPGSRPALGARPDRVGHHRRPALAVHRGRAGHRRGRRADLHDLRSGVRGTRAASPAPRSPLWPWAAQILSPSPTWRSPGGPSRSSTARSGPM